MPSKNASVCVNETFIDNKGRCKIPLNIILRRTPFNNYKIEN